MKPLGEGSNKVARVIISDSRVIAGKGARRYAMQNGRPSARNIVLGRVSNRYLIGVRSEKIRLSR